MWYCCERDKIKQSASPTTTVGQFSGEVVFRPRTGMLAKEHYSSVTDMAMLVLSSREIRNDLFYVLLEIRPLDQLGFVFHERSWVAAPIWLWLV